MNRLMERNVPRKVCKILTSFSFRNSDISLTRCIDMFRIIIAVNSDCCRKQYWPAVLYNGERVYSICILYNQRVATYTIFFIIIGALHVSGGISAHHQELIKLYMQRDFSSIDCLLQTVTSQRENIASLKT